MKAALIDKVGSIKFITADAPVLSQDNEVLIRVVLTGICGSEVHAFHGKHPFRILRSYPVMNVPVLLKPLDRK